MKTRKINSFYKIIVLSFLICAIILYQSIIESYFTPKNCNIAFAIEKTQIITPTENYSLLINLLKIEDEFLKFKTISKLSSNNEKKYFLANNALGHVQYLSENIGSRESGNIGEKIAFNYARSYFMFLGYQPRVQRFHLPNGKMSNNIWAVKEGRLIDEIIVIGAHIDSVKNSPGANDNASGVGILLELARVLKEIDINPTIILIIFGAEEKNGSRKDDHHFGSRFYVSKLSDSIKSKTKGMICIDMVGVGKELYARSTEYASLDMVERIIKTAKSKNIKIDYLKSPEWSDHEAFEKIGIPAVWLEMLPDPNWHTKNDKFKNIEIDNLQQIGDLIYSFFVNYQTDKINFLYHYGIRYN
jgi:hypothetical protein